MQLTAYAEWLNKSFYDFDRAILEFYHELAVTADSVLNPIARILAFVGEGAMLCFIVASVLVLFKSTRKASICMSLSIGIGALITNVALKNLIARPRPFAAEYTQWWEFVGSPPQAEYSFPSGHMTSVTAGMLALCLCLSVERKKPSRAIIPCAIYVIAMGASRNYLMVHYPSDIIGGAICGTVGALLGIAATHGIYRLLKRHSNNRLCCFILNSDFENLFSKNSKT